jgi:hypothetical protein
VRRSTQASPSHLTNITGHSDADAMAAAVVSAGNAGEVPGGYSKDCYYDL